MFTPSEIIRIAVCIEGNGQRFYRYMADNVDDQTAVLMFNYLADQEEVHSRLFAEMLDDVGSETDLPETYDGEHDNYLAAYGSQLIFANEVDPESLGIKDSRAALKFAGQREMESVHYYQEIKEYLPEKKQHVVKRIIEEEKKHFLKISNLLKAVT